jgi:transcriptional regulator with XRE-family HTH domain
LRELGARIQGLHLDRNLSQDQVVEAAGVGRSTVVRLEGGQGIRLLSFIQVLRALGALEDLARFPPEAGVSPLQLLERKGRRRRQSGRSRALRDGDGARRG